MSIRGFTRGRFSLLTTLAIIGLMCLVVVAFFSVPAWALPTTRAAPDNMSVALLTNKINSVALVPMVASVPAWTMVPKVLSPIAASIVPATSNRMIAQHLRGCDLLQIATETTFYPITFTLMLRQTPTALAVENSLASPTFAGAWAEIMADAFWIPNQDLAIPNNSRETLIETSFWNAEITHSLNYDRAFPIAAVNLRNGRILAGYNGRSVDMDLAIIVAGAASRSFDHNGLMSSRL
jgi:hypothetical protein